MTVRLDLRPNRLDESAAKAVKTARAACIFSFSIFVFSFLVFAAVSWRAFLTAGAVGGYVEANKIYEARIAAAGAELKQISEQTEHISRDLEFVLGGVPALEFLRGISASLNDGVVVESVEMSSQSALIKGAAFSDGGVLAFAEALARSSAVSSVGIPAITSSERGGVEMKIFSLDIKLHNVREVLLSSSACGGAFAGWTAA